VKKTRTIITVSMVWVGILVFFAKGYFAKIRDKIKEKAGTLPGPGT
jgi:hypothetical protein